MHGIEFQQGSHEKHQDPIVMDHILGIIDHSLHTVFLEQRHQEVEILFQKQQARHDEKDIGQRHDATQAADDHVIAFISLHHLHTAETDGTQKKQTGSHLLKTEEIKGNAYHHQGATGKKNKIL